MSRSDDKPYTKYRAGRVRRPQTDVPVEPPGEHAVAQARRGRQRRHCARRGRRAAQPAPPPAPGRAGQHLPRRPPPRGEPLRAAPTSRSCPAAERKRRLFHWWYLLAIPLAAGDRLRRLGLSGLPTFNKAVVKSNHRITKATRAALVDPQGGVLSAPTTLLVLGSDQRGHEPARSDSILLMRFDPKTHTVSQLSIPRDTLVNVPGHGQTKINEAYFWGGSALAVKVVSSYTGVPINHVMLVSFHGFPALVNSVGGVVVNVPHDLTSWYSGNRLVHFKKGPQLMNGKQALIYSRVRHADSDFMRMGRQQQVVQALEKKITRPRNLFRLPWIGARFMRGVGTDLSTRQIVELAYLDWRAKGAHQHKTVLLGTPEMIGGGSYVVVDPGGPGPHGPPVPQPLARHRGRSSTDPPFLPARPLVPHPLARRERPRPSRRRRGRGTRANSERERDPRPQAAGRRCSGSRSESPSPRPRRRRLGHARPPGPPARRRPVPPRSSAPPPATGSPATARGCSSRSPRSASPPPAGRGSCRCRSAQRRRRRRPAGWR